MQCQIILRRTWTSERLLRAQYRRYATATVDRNRQQFIWKTIDILKLKTNDPLWSLIPLVKDGSTYQLTGALRKASVSLEEYRLWQPCSQQPTLERALRSMPQYQQTIPHWLMFHLLAAKVNSFTDVVDPLLDLVLSQLPSYPLHLKATTLTFSAAHLGSRDLLVPLRAIIDEFLALPRPITTPTFPYSAPGTASLPTVNQLLAVDDNPPYDLYFNFFLRALAQVPKHSRLSHHYIEMILAAMSNGSPASISKVHPDTYSALLRSPGTSLKDSTKGDHYVNYSLAHLLRHRMRLDNVEPSPEHSEAFTHYFAVAELEKARKNRRRSGRLEQSEEESTKTIVATTIHSPSPSSTKSAWSLKYTNILKSRHATARIGARTAMSTEDALAILHAASQDMGTGTKDFVVLFHRITKAPMKLGKLKRHQASIEMYTVLLQGLLHRKELQKALEVWEVLFKQRGLPLDKDSVTYGARILTQSGRPGAAFELLEEVTAKPPVSPPMDSPFGEALSSPISLYDPVTLDAAAIYGWMHTLRRIGRPDAVFALWDNMFNLYGVLHSGSTLNIMLETARKAALANARSFRRQLANYFNFRRKKPQPVSGFELKEPDYSTREKAAKEMRALLGEGGAKKWRGGLWRDKPPEETAREIFLQVMFGMDMARNAKGFLSPTPLDVIKAPARSVRSDWDSGGGVVGLGVALPSLKMEQCQFDVRKEVMYRWVPKPGSLHSGEVVPRPHYPHLVLDDSNFFDYFCLLSVTRRTTEVALTMAWMRHLGIYPSEATLAMAMVLWGEVSVEAPVVQGLSQWGRSGEEDSPPMDEYERFVNWLEGWVGRKRIPEEHVLRRFRITVKEIRESEFAPKTAPKKNPARKRKARKRS